MKIPILNIVIDPEQLRLIYMVLMLSSVFYLISQVNDNGQKINYVYFSSQHSRAQ